MAGHPPAADRHGAGRPPDLRAARPTAARARSIQDFLLTNTNEGESTVFSIDASKTWRTGAGRFDAYLGYGHQDVKDVNPGTSSTASSNWDNVAVSDPNNPGLETSNYEIEHRFTGSFAWRKAFFGDYETSIALFGERRSGRPYSYTFGGGSPRLGRPAPGRAAAAAVLRAGRRRDLRRRRARPAT